MLALERSAADQYLLHYERWGAGVITSPPFRGAPVHNELRVRLGSLLDIPDSSPLRVMRNTLTVWAGGEPVWWRKIEAPLNRGLPVYVARNSIGSNAARPDFNGRFAHWSFTSRLPEWQAGPFRSLRLTLGGRGQGTEPLLAVGTTGKANTLAIEWRGTDRAVLVYDHWGYGSYRSKEFAWKADRSHVMEVSWTALEMLGQGAAGTIENGEIDVSVDGTDVWKAAVPFYCSDGASVAIGQNRAGSSVASAELTAVVIDAFQNSVLRGETPPSNSHR
jgi:hypothetical protein